MFLLHQHFVSQSGLTPEPASLHPQFHSAERGWGVPPSVSPPRRLEDDDRDFPACGQARPPLPPHNGLFLLILSPQTALLTSHSFSFPPSLTFSALHAANSSLPGENGPFHAHKYSAWVNFSLDQTAAQLSCKQAYFSHCIADHTQREKRLIRAILWLGKSIYRGQRNNKKNNVSAFAWSGLNALATVSWSVFA